MRMISISILTMKGNKIMTRPLMPKATAVWLVENTTLSFEQIADFCEMHSLEIQAIADGEVASHIMGLDPVANGQLTSEEMNKFCQQNNITSTNPDSIRRFFANANVDEAIRQFKANMEVTNAG